VAFAPAALLAFALPDCIGKLPHAGNEPTLLGTAPLGIFPLGFGVDFQTHPASVGSVQKACSIVLMKGRELRFVGSARKLALLAEKRPNPGLLVSWQVGDPNGI
jgi:hypothetical protein